MDDFELDSLYKTAAADSHIAALRAIFAAGAASVTPTSESLAPAGGALTAEDKAQELLHAAERVLGINEG
jgi:hypothetical protein